MSLNLVGLLLSLVISEGDQTYEYQKQHGNHRNITERR
jgi:hypothetical protein